MTEALISFDWKLFQIRSSEKSFGVYGEVVNLRIKQFEFFLP